MVRVWKFEQRGKGNLPDGTSIPRLAPNLLWKLGGEALGETFLILKDDWKAICNASTLYMSLGNLPSAGITFIATSFSAIGKFPTE